MSSPADTIREALETLPMNDPTGHTEAAFAALTELEQQLAVQRDATQNQYEMTCEAIRRGEAIEADRDRYKRAHEVAAAFANDTLIPRAVAAEAALADANKRIEVLEIMDMTATAKQWEMGMKYEKQRADDYADTLREVQQNAEAWHGPELDNGHARALKVIAGWCRAALDRHTQATR